MDRKLSDSLPNLKNIQTCKEISQSFSEKACDVKYQQKDYKVRLLCFYICFWQISPALRLITVIMIKMINSIFQNELKELEEKFRKAMVANAGLDNEKSALNYQVRNCK